MLKFIFVIIGSIIAGILAYGITYGNETIKEGIYYYSNFYDRYRYIDHDEFSFYLSIAFSFFVGGFVTGLLATKFLKVNSKNAFFTGLLIVIPCLVVGFLDDVIRFEPFLDWEYIIHFLVGWGVCCIFGGIGCLAANNYAKTKVTIISYSKKYLFINIIVGLLISIIVFFILSIIHSILFVILLSSVHVTDFVDFLTVVIVLIISLFFGGSHIGKNVKDRPWIYGGLISLPIFIVNIILEANKSVRLDREYLIDSIKILVLIFLAGAVGALYGFNKQKKKAKQS